MSATNSILSSTLTSPALRDAYTDFMLSRQAMNCRPATLEYYKYIGGDFLEWIKQPGVTAPDEITADMFESTYVKVLAKCNN